MSDVFISYAREDRDRAQQLAHALEQQHWSVWWDREALPGEIFSQIIAQELAGAKAVIVLWSGASVESDWVKDEAQEGLKRRILVPARLETVDSPFGFRQIQTADLSDWDGSASHPEMQSLLRGVGKLISRPLTHTTDLDAPPKPRPRNKRLYLTASIGLSLVLAVAAYFALRPSGNRPCSSELKDAAAELTSRGLLMIDPNGNHDAAVLLFDRAVDKCRDYAEAYFWRGQSHVALQKNDRALEDFETVLRLNPGPGMRRDVQKFIAELEGTGIKQTPSPSGDGTANAAAHVNTNTNSVATNGTPNSNHGTNANATNANNSQAGSDPPRTPVGDIFANDKGTRIGATTRLIIQRKNDPAAVQAAIRLALSQPDNKSGVINTLVYLQSVDPPLLKQNREEIEKLLTAVKDNGPQTVEHIRKVQTLLNR